MQVSLPNGFAMVSGVLPRDAELRTVGKNNSSSTRFSVKVGERPPQQEGEKPEAIWASCQCWHDVARAASTLKKGDHVFCIGKIETYKDPKTENEYKNLVCEYISLSMKEIPVQPQTAAEPKQAPEEVIDVFDDNGVPF